ncbi:MAG: sensor protein [Gemmatimonadetes bacterium]|nr:sensor protein [Gemmatimonadota bacterium]
MRLERLRLTDDQESPIVPEVGKASVWRLSKPLSTDDSLPEATMKSASSSSASPETRGHRGGSPAAVAAAAQHREHGHDHAVQFYDDEAFLATMVSEFLAGGLSSGQPVIVIATASHRKAFLAGLRELGVDVASARTSGQFTLLDAAQTLEKFMVGSRPDPRRFRDVVGGLIERSLVSRQQTALCAYGEMVDLLWKQGNAEGAIRLEDLWNDLAKSYDFSLLCAYNMGNFCRASDAEQFQMICAQHTHVAPTERYVEGDAEARLLEVSLLQQRARALEAEIAHREVLEQRLRETVLALQHRERELRDVLENAAEGIHLVGPDGIIQWANDGELQLLGYRAEEYIGRHIAEFHADQDVIAGLLQRLTRGESVHAFPARLLHKDGSIRHVLINSNVRFEDGEFHNTRCFTRDITALHTAGVERESAMERERVARAAAEQANRAKSDFLAVMSHELRTPLNAIGGYAELMELGIHGPVTPPQREALERIQRSQRLLQGLVNQVLNYARVESGNVRYNFVDVILDEALRTAEGSVVPQMRAKGIRYSYTGCDTAVIVRVDGEKLQQIVLNLLTNAVKFTNAGGTVALSVELSDDSVAVHVTDTGIGVAADKFEAIFDPFVQVDANYTRTRDGVGLGLAISRDLARGMGGELRIARSKEGEGSTFTLTINRVSCSPG